MISSKFAMINGGGAAAGPAGPSDPANISFLASWDGVDGTRAFTDESPTPLGITFAGAVSELDTAQKKFGDSGLYLDSTGYVLIDHDASVSIAGNTQFTVEAFIRPDAASIARANSSVFNKRDSGSAEEYAMYLDAGVPRAAIYRSGNLEASAAATTKLVADTWYHVCFTRDGNTVTMFVDGVPEGSDTITTEPSANTGPLNLGRSAFAGGREFTGHYDEVRICTEVFYDAAGFDPPTEPFTRP